MTPSGMALEATAMRESAERLVKQAEALERSAAQLEQSVSTKQMSARDALTAVGDWANEAVSFVETFPNHDDHGDEQNDEGEYPECRFDNTEMDRGFDVLQELIAAAERVLAAEEQETHADMEDAMDGLYIALHGGPNTGNASNWEQGETRAFPVKEDA